MANRVLLGKKIDWDATAIGILGAAVGYTLETSLFTTPTINNRSLGDINNDGNVNITDAIAANKYANDPSLNTQAEIDYIEQVLGPYMVTNSSTYSAYIVGDGLWVSKAGADVLRADDYDLLFDSTRAEAGLQFSAGSATVTVTSSTATGTYYSSWIYFNGDQSALNYTPVVWANRVTSNTYRCVPELRVGVDRYTSGGNILATSWTFHNTYMEFLDNIRFRFVIRNFGNSSGFYGLTAGTYTFNYIVLTMGGSSVTSA